MSSIAAWANAPASNRGWIFIPTSSFGADVRSSDYTAVPGERPALSVMYTFTPPTTPPAAPTDLAATPTIGTQIDLHWTDNASDESVFQIDRATNGSGGPFTLLATVGTNVTTYMDSDLAANTEYCYRVRAANAYGPSAYTSIVCATTTANHNNAIDFGGTNAYVTFGDPAALDLAQFTIETWFRHDGTGVTANTGTSGVLAVPLVTKGRGEAEGSNVDMNYFLGIRVNWVCWNLVKAIRPVQGCHSATKLVYFVVLNSIPLRDKITECRTRLEHARPAWQIQLRAASSLSLEVHSCASGLSSSCS